MAYVSFRSVVDPSDCDFLGHMNVSRYFQACSDGVFAIQTEMGLTADDMLSGRRLSFAVVHAESEFRAELIAGESIFLETEVVEIGTKSIIFRHRLVRAADKTIAFQTLFKCVMLGLETRTAEPIPDEVKETAKDFMAAN
ncbi:acyl-CoA thioesterase [Marimonas arenosa]|uniref:Acyl-CoA thioesterase n=1 Tax=Marimonas arenosa TaxID=1795305 RepID=A0AAE3WFA5_9RHOB|nr:acyl-CoA thioesterase [Marimonas arenosa]MDQ2090647.1 acyl-CoA thioesterase [Marimonas arenosa]